MAIVVVDEDSVKQEKERVKSILMPLEDLVMRLKDQRQRLISALNGREAKEVKEEEKKKKEVEQRQIASRAAGEVSKMERERRASGAGTVKRSFAVFTHDNIPEFKGIPVMTEADVKKEGKENMAKLLQLPL
eukprot:15628544-Heterocapsa_arctica.AAC.1